MHSLKAIREGILCEVFGNWHRKVRCVDTGAVFLKCIRKNVLMDGILFVVALKHTFSHKNHIEADLVLPHIYGWLINLIEI